MKFVKPLDPVAMLWSQCLEFSLSVTGVSLPFSSKPVSSWLELHSVSGSLSGLMWMDHLTPPVADGSTILSLLMKYPLERSVIRRILMNENRYAHKTIVLHL